MSCIGGGGGGIPEGIRDLATRVHREMPRNVVQGRRWKSPRVIAWLASRSLTWDGDWARGHSVGTPSSGVTATMATVGGGGAGV